MLDIIVIIISIILLIGLGKVIISGFQLSNGYAKNIPFLHIEGIPNCGKGTEINLSFSPREIMIGDNYKISNDNVIGMDFKKTNENKSGFILRIYFSGKDGGEREVYLRLKSYNQCVFIEKISKQINKEKGFIPQENQMVEL
jgi:hypothetical protein